MNQLFTSDSTWNRLVSFNIEQVRRNKSEIDEDLTDVRTLFSQQALGNLKSLQEIRFTTGTEHPFPIDSGTQFEKLTQITVETTDYRVYNVFNQIADLVDDGVFPSLRTFRVVCVSDSWHHCRPARHRLRRAGVKVYVSRFFSQFIEQYWTSWE